MFPDYENCLDKEESRLVVRDLTNFLTMAYRHAVAGNKSNYVQENSGKVLSEIFMDVASIVDMSEDVRLEEIAEQGHWLFNPEILAVRAIQHINKLGARQSLGTLYRVMNESANLAGFEFKPVYKP